MSAIREFLMDREPVLFMELVRAGVLALVAFGLDLSTEQIVSVYAVAASVLSFVLRRRVTPPKPPSGKGPLQAVGLLLAVVAIALPGCSWLKQNAKPALSVIDVAAQQACEEFASKHRDELNAPRGIDDVVEWYCSDPAVLEVFRARERRKLRRRIARSGGE